jgi:hypothetical protein
MGETTSTRTFRSDSATEALSDQSTDGAKVVDKSRSSDPGQPPPSEQTVTIAPKDHASHSSAPLTSADLQQLRARVVGKEINDEAGEEISAALGLGERIRSCKIPVDDARNRLEFIVSCAMATPPQLLLARDERLRLQLEVYQHSGIISRTLARISSGSSAALVIAALVASLFVWAGVIFIIRVLIDLSEIKLPFFDIKLSDQFKNVFLTCFSWMKGRCL